PGITRKVGRNRTTRCGERSRDWADCPIVHGSTTRRKPVVTVPESKGGREVLTLVVLLVLAALWAVVLLPPLLKSRATRLQSSDSIGDFNYKLDVLSRTNGSTARRPRRSSSVSMSRPLPLPQYGAPYSSARGARRPVGPSSAPASAARSAKRRADV